MIALCLQRNFLKQDSRDSSTSVTSWTSWILCDTKLRAGNILQNCREDGGTLNFTDLAHLGHRPPMKMRPYAVLSPSASWGLLWVSDTEEENVPYLCLSLPTNVIPVVPPGIIGAYIKKLNHSPHVWYCGYTFVVLLSSVKLMRLQRSGADINTDRIISLEE